MTAALVELVDGTCVQSDAEAWKFECLAREILRKPLEERRAWLADFETKNGAAGADRLKVTMRALHEKARMLP